jgi:3-methylcrotonyl-CoA carboxylase alpha subunit
MMKAGVFTVRIGDQGRRVELAADGSARVGESAAALEIEVLGPNAYRVRQGGVSVHAFVAGPADARQVFVDGEVYEVEVSQDGAGRRRQGGRHADAVGAPMPGKVTQVLVGPGDVVRRGDVVVKLEAMKMELAVRAPREGVVRSVACREGELVQPGVPLVELE